MLRHGLRRAFTKLDLYNQVAYRNASKDVSKIVDPIVITDDGSTIVCLHPEKSYPYECTRPMPELISKQTVLKTQREEAMKVYSTKKTDKEIADELASLTHTTFHRWLPKKRERKNGPIAKDRPYL